MTFTFLNILKFYKIRCRNLKISHSKPMQPCNWNTIEIVATLGNTWTIQTGSSAGQENVPGNRYSPQKSRNPLCSSETMQVELEPYPEKDMGPGCSLGGRAGYRCSG
jgi:hypothetical protein